MIVSIFALGVALAAPNTLAITIPTVPVGNPGNPADTRYIDFHHPSGVGAVAYPFRIGRTEVTNAQYTAFLNAVAASDPYDLYDTSMASDTVGGIVRSGSSGSYTYAVKAPALSGAYTYDNKPVVCVGFGDVMRFANWLHNQQPSGLEGPGTTETGAYTLNGAISGIALAAVTRNAGARWWLPNEDEWYKAAYHKNDGVTGHYWDEPTSTNSAPNNNPPSSETGNSANFLANDYTTGNSSYPLTDAGAYTLSDSPYGTFDQGGNVWEWNETPFFYDRRGVRGGSYSDLSYQLLASDWSYNDLYAEANVFGFRVASAVPEPSAISILCIGALGLLLRMRRTKAVPSIRTRA